MHRSSDRYQCFRFAAHPAFVNDALSELYLGDQLACKNQAFSCFAEAIGTFPIVLQIKTIGGSSAMKLLAFKNCFLG